MSTEPASRLTGVLTYVLDGQVHQTASGTVKAMMRRLITGWGRDNIEIDVHTDSMVIHAKRGDVKRTYTITIDKGE